MKWSRLLAIFSLLLTLSHGAQCADAPSGKAPLTPAERAQCLVQLAEVNKGLRAYNAKLDELKAMEADFDAQRAALAKDQAAVNRRDRAAMQALNEKISKNNELVLRYEQMNALLKKLENENKELAAQFHEACDKRPAAPPPAQTRSSDSTAGSMGVERQIDAALAEMCADAKQGQKEVVRVAKARATGQS